MSATAVSRRPYGVLPDGREVGAWTLTHQASQVQATVLELGGVLASLRAPDREGTAGEITLGYDDLAGYLDDHAFLGATVGRFANRIGHGRFVLDGVEHRLPENNGPATLHGGPDGFNRRLWDAVEVEDGVSLSLHSPDGDMGFPGAMAVTLRLTLDGHGLRWSYAATTDAPTVVNLTNHTYWNLGGPGTGTVEDHVLLVEASSFVPVDGDSLPLGPQAPVAGTALDFRTPHAVGARLRDPDEQLLAVGGYDHCLLLDTWGRMAPAHALAPAGLSLHHPASGRVLEVRTDQPGVQLYSGNQLTGAVAGRGGRPMRQGDGLCLETQHLPDSPNRPEYPTTVLRPGERFETTTLVGFSTR